MDFETIFYEANNGDADAQVILGKLYYEGNVVEQDYIEAFEWFLKAAQQGDSYGWCWLGIMFYTGNGVNQDYDEALKCFATSARMGNEDARNALETLYVQKKSDGEDVPEWLTVGHGIFEIVKHLLGL